MSYWAVTCPEVYVTCRMELWRIWQRENCVAGDWSPEQDFHLEEPRADFSENVRNWLRQVESGDTVIPFLMKNRLGTPGDVIRSAVTDREWQATIPKGCYKLNSSGAALGRRIIVNWWRDGMPGAQVVLIPPGARPHGLRATIQKLSESCFQRFIEIIRDRRNWIDYQPGP